jgi:hypothetical protein
MLIFGQVGWKLSGGSGEGHHQEMLGMLGLARWLGWARTNPFTTTLFSLRAKMLCNRIAKAIVGDSIAALCRSVLCGQFSPIHPPNLLGSSDDN